MKFCANYANTRYSNNLGIVFVCGLCLGSFGRVSKVRRISDGRVLVWKELDYGKMNDKEKQ